MKVRELMTKCCNCYYGETKVTICDGTALEILIEGRDRL